MKKIPRYTGRVQDTKMLAQQLSQALTGGEVVALSGPLGSGKTTFAQHLAKTLGFTGSVTSPTFTLLQTYEPAKLPNGQPVTIHHLDWYRLENLQELEALGLEEYLGQAGTVTLIEWADKFPDFLKNYKPINIFLELWNITKPSSF